MCGALEIILLVSVDKKFFRPTVPFPAGLTEDELYVAMVATEEFFSDLRQKTGISLGNVIQGNTFSGVVSNIFTKFLSDNSDFKQFSDQRYPDLKHIKSNLGLDVKMTKNLWKGGEGHNGHSGWHIVVVYQLTDEGDVHFQTAAFANLNGFETANPDWKYQGSSVNSNNSQRTETYVTNSSGTAKIRDGTFYFNSDITPEPTKQMIIARYKVTSLPVPTYSVLYDPERKD